MLTVKKQGYSGKTAYTKVRNISIYHSRSHNIKQTFSLLLKDCVPRYYGSDCNTPCGQCREDDVCNSVTGYCPHGCVHHTGLEPDETVRKHCCNITQDHDN